MTLAERIQQHWRAPTAVSLALTPLSLVYGLVTKLRKAAYICGVLKIYRFDIPVVVVGNLTVGGTGKTPFVMTLAEQLKTRGWRPGIVSRGYRGSVAEAELVPADGDPRHFGDEPVLVARKTGLPVAVSKRRAQAVEKLLQESVDIVISDDGLQHTLWPVVRRSLWSTASRDWVTVFCSPLDRCENRRLVLHPPISEFGAEVRQARANTASAPLLAVRAILFQEKRSR